VPPDRVFNDLSCQTALTAGTDAKGILPHCKTENRLLYGWEKFGCEQERYHEIIREAVRTLGSLGRENWNEEQYRTDVCNDVNSIVRAHKESRQDLRTIRDRLRAAITQLERAERAIEKIPKNPVYKSLLENHIRPALNAARFYADRVTFRSGGPRKRKGEPLSTIAKRQAAACAMSSPSNTRGRSNG
jgi:hypothetical protein